MPIGWQEHPACLLRSKPYYTQWGFLPCKPDRITASEPNPGNVSVMSTIIVNEASSCVSVDSTAASVPDPVCLWISLPLDVDAWHFRKAETCMARGGGSGVVVVPPPKGAVLLFHDPVALHPGAGWLSWACRNCLLRTVAILFHITFLNRLLHS